MAGEVGNGREFKRAPIFKMFTAELKNTTHALAKNGDDQWESQYYLTPSGEAVSKVMLIGVATEKEDVGDDQPFWRVRISDPTGGIMVYAGKFQPEAAQLIASMDIPCFVAVVGRPSIYQPEGGPIVSIRPDSIVVVDDATRNSFIVDAAQQLLMRVKEMKATPEAERIKKTRAIYESITPAALLDIADMAVKSLMPQQPEPENKKENVQGDQKDAGAEQKAPAPEQKKPEEKKPEAKPPADKKDGKKQDSRKGVAKKQEPKTEPSAEEVLAQAKDLIYRELVAKKHLRLGEIPGILTARGLDPNKVAWEDAVKALMHEGMCVEPRLGELKAV